MNTNLLGYVLAKLDERAINWKTISRDTGVPYETLKKIAHRRTPNPGVKHVQTLADFFQANGKAAAETCKPAEGAAHG